MLKNPFERLIEWENDPEDFKMPYAVYGSVDLQVTQSRYNKLTNRSTNPLVVRFQQR